MAKTLNEFLKDRAQWDYAALTCAYCAIPEARQFNRHTTDILASQRRGDTIMIGYNYVRDAWIVSICQAGEALDQMREKEPELFKQLPPYPWDAIIQARHVATHYGESNHDAFRPEAHQAMMKKWDTALAKLGDTHAPNADHIYDQSALFQKAMISLKYASFYSAICEGHAPEDVITVTNSERIRKLYEAYGAEDREAGYEPPNEQNWSIALAAVIDSARLHANLSMDSFEKTSGLCRMNYPEIFNNVYYGAVKHIRNQWAHFEDRLHIEDKATELHTLFGCLSAMEHLRARFTHVPPSKKSNDAEVARAVDLVIADYTRLILGPAERDTAKCADMDGFVSWIVKNFNGKARLHDAAIYAAGQTLQLPREQATQILGYVRDHKTALSDPSKLLEDLPGKCQVLQIGVRDYVNNLQAVLQVDKHKTKILGMKVVHHAPFSLSALKAAFTGSGAER